MSNSNINSNYSPNKVAYNQNPVESRKTTGVDIINYLEKLKKRWKPALAVFLLTVGATVAASRLLKKQYQAEGKLLFKPNYTQNIAFAEGAGEINTVPNNQTSLLTQQQIISSRLVLQQTIEALKLKNEAGEPMLPEALKQKLQVKIEDGSDVIKIGYKGEDPYNATKIVNTLMDVYIGERIHSNKSQTANADSFVNNQIPQVEQNLKKYESILQDFREKNNIVDLKEEKRVLVSELGNLNRQIATVGADLKGTQAQTSALQSQLGLSLNQAIAVEQLGNSPTIHSVLTQLAQTESELAEERKRFKDNHPSIVSLQDKKASLNQYLQQAISNSVGKGVKVSEGLLQSNSVKQNPLDRFITLKIEELSQQRQLASLYQYQEVYRKRAKELPRLEQKEQEMERYLDNARENYDNLLTTQQEIQILQNQQPENVEIIEVATVPNKGSSGKMALIVLGIILALFLSNFTAILLEMQDRSLKTINEIKQKLPYNVLGMIPFDPEADHQGIVVQREPDSFASEIYRIIQANLKFVTSQQPPKVILVTSSVPGEGKSTVTANLSAAIAQLGRRVLLIDGDLRRSHQHKLWGTTNGLGIKDVITKKAVFKEVISQPMSKLDLLTPGIIPGNPLAILDSAEMGELVALGRRDYEIVLIDAPPLPVTADVLTLSKLADGIIFVSRPGVVEQESAELAKEILTNTGQKILGITINGVNPQDFDRYSYYGKYGKGYFNSNSSSQIAIAPH
ncbi:MAG: polysaccharide biosynthesis tyrosine autokinase [Xenococcaceae cyanobacterium MO_207.B15]|nr:polysaccharide biosynthesis tyrosine autokinase [Xenococcaceae cyanobacterium MO_207.B15]